MPEVLATGVQTCAGSRCLEMAGVPLSTASGRLGGAVTVATAQTSATQSRNVGRTVTVAQASISGASKY